MSNFIETRGQLAKLLAAENLFVQHDVKATTASFNVKDRVLTLPVLQTEDKFIYNMMTAHEVGHALYTPEDWNERVPENVPFDFVNVIEDVRIEKFIQQKFPGLRPDFTKGYDGLNNADFFGIKDKDISKLSFIDRINLHFKLGARAVVPFSEKEMTYVTAIDEADTFDKVCLVSSMLRDYLDANREKEQSLTEELQVSTTGDGDTETNNQQSRSSSSSDEGDTEDGDDETDQTSGGTHADELTSQTQSQFDREMSKMSRSGCYDSEIVYIKSPEVNLDDIVINVKELRDSFDTLPEWTYHADRCRSEYTDFIKSIRRDVNFMVQQFEMKKSADAYARQQTHKTGVLNTEVLHNYKLSDDLFLRQTIIPDGKNHGMIMFVDWSGSMSTNIVSVVKQIITLVQFCRKVQIPFEVYTFTTGDGSRRVSGDKVIDGAVSTTSMNVVQVMTSTAKGREIDTDLYNLYCQAYYLGESTKVRHSSHLDMGGTPLNNAMFLIPELVKEFRLQTNAQKVSFCVLSDGESSPLYYWKLINGADETYARPTYSYYQRVMLRDGSNVIDLGNPEEGATGKIANYLQNLIEDFSLFNIYVNTLNPCIRYMAQNEALLDEKSFRKENAAVSYTTGWPMICCVSPKAFGQAQQEIEVESGESKAKIKSALKKFLASKQSSKNLLTRIVDSFA